MGPQARAYQFSSSATDSAPSPSTTASPWWTLPPARLAFFKPELALFLACGAWEYGSRWDFVSRAFLVPKPGGKWRIIIDLRHQYSDCIRKRIRMETLKGLRHLTKKGDYIFSFDLKDGPYYFTTFTEVMVRHMRTPEPEPAPAASAPTP
eukprot:jgi/Tetstr1/421412/TSEL_012361.t1